MAINFKKHFSDREAYAARERRCRIAFEEASGIDLKPSGIGVESAEIFAGYAAEHGETTGGADYAGLGGDLLVEVTGSNVPLSLDAPLWLNRTKVRAAWQAAREGRQTVVLHEIPTRDGGKPVLRAIVLDLNLFARLTSARGRVRVTAQGQTMYVIPTSDPAVMSLTQAVMEVRGWSMIRDCLAPLGKGLLEAASLH